MVSRSLPFQLIGIFLQETKVEAVNDKTILTALCPRNQTIDPGSSFVQRAFLFATEDKSLIESCRDTSFAIISQFPFAPLKSNCSLTPTHAACFSLLHVHQYSLAPGIFALLEFHMCPSSPLSATLQKPPTQF